MDSVDCDGGAFHRIAAVLDLHSRRVPGFAMDIHHNAALARAALCMAIAVRGGSVRGVIFHTDYAEVCVKPRICGDGLRSWGLLVDFSA